MKALPFAHVYHLADAENWPSIRRGGLLSATRLLKLSGLSMAAQARIERFRRPCSFEMQFDPSSGADIFASCKSAS